jgi:DNA-binding NtrC family response regulator
MSKNKPLILVLEDEKSQRDYYELLLSETGFNVKSYSYYEDAVAALDIYEFHAFVVDLKVDVKEQKNAGAGGDNFMKIALQKYPGAPIAVISAFFGNDWGTRLTRLFMETTSCLYAHIEKPGELKLKDWAKRALQYYHLKYPPKASASHYHSEDVRVRKIVNELLPVVASSSLPVFIIGETGTGKEDIARLIHNHPENPFRNGPFVAVNCAAVNDELLLSELFGHVHGAYTGAHAHRLGWFLEASGWNYDTQNKAKTTPNVSYLPWLESCNKQIKYATKAKDSTNTEDVILMNNIYHIADESHAEYVFADTHPGTLFLDEIGDLTPSAEVALLRALDGYGIRPLGYTGPALLPHCCIIAATNRIKNTSDLRDDTMSNGSKKGIRKELYHRLAGWVLELPPLRERRTKDRSMEWIMSLEKWAARDSLHFQEGDLETFANSFTADKEGRLWDGNWRELKYFYARAKSIALRRKGNHLIKKEDLDFASQWVLVDEYAGDNEQLNLSFGKEENNIISEKLFDSNREIVVRLECILVIHYVLQECENKPMIGIDRIIDEIDFTPLELCNKVLRLVAKEDLLKEAIKIAQEAGRITNPAIDMLMDKKGALKSWWRGNAVQTGYIINHNFTKYKSILNIVEKLSPTNFYISKGYLKVKDNGY